MTTFVTTDNVTNEVQLDRRQFDIIFFCIVAVGEGCRTRSLINDLPLASSLRLLVKEMIAL